MRFVSCGRVLFLPRLSSVPFASVYGTAGRGGAPANRELHTSNYRTEHATIAKCVGIMSIHRSPLKPPAQISHPTASLARQSVTIISSPSEFGPQLV
ncbi:hypothetical protein L210DRAFT_3563882 [Boletus edulis BED1]|uniref:Uncharacterized protein n=1 Tax=Boletus edulis BED1 TaxID=1328754 RepID=A0AAD4BG13_BOLED|nr:hypothetical protein L210DRAFT_3563882 [Boletus edulis BED1]